MSKTVEDFKAELISAITVRTERDSAAERELLKAYERANEETKKIETELRELVSGLGFEIIKTPIPNTASLIIRGVFDAYDDVPLIEILPMVKKHNNGTCDFWGYNITTKGKYREHVLEFDVLYVVTNFLKEIILNQQA